MWMIWLEKLGCKVGSLPSTYLGMPLGAPFNSVAALDDIEESFRKRLAMWKWQYISKGGRITLIRSTLSSLPLYFMSILHLPRVVRMRLEQIQKDFPWGDGALERKPHLVRWLIVCIDKRKRGLEVKSLTLLNKALLGKWTWRFATKREAFWNQVIRGKYGEDWGGWCSREVRECFGVGLWKTIRNLDHLVSTSCLLWWVMVRDQTIYKRWSFDVNRFYWLGGILLKKGLFFVHEHLIWTVFFFVSAVRVSILLLYILGCYFSSFFLI